MSATVPGRTIYTVTERRGVWLAIASALAAGALSALIPGIASANWQLLTIGSILASGSVLLFVWLLQQLNAADEGKAEVDRTHNLLISTDAESFPELPTPSYTSNIQEMYQLGPSSWLGPPIGMQPAEITLRVVLALPAVTANVYSGDVATLIRGESRESCLVETLEDAPVTAWLRSLQDIWHCTNKTRWVVHGSGQPDLTQLIFRPSWNSGIRPPLTARCAVLTGWRPALNGELEPGLRGAFDLMINLLELDSQRKPSPIRHQTTPPPAPAALSLEEVANYLLNLMEAGQLAKMIGQHFVPTADLQHGYVGMWLDLSGVEFQRVVDMSKTSKIDGAAGSPGHVRLSVWPLAGGETPTRSASVEVASFMDEMLELGGYRGVQRYFDWLRE